MERMPSACSCSPFPGPARLLAALSLWPRQPAPAASPPPSPKAQRLKKRKTFWCVILGPLGPLQLWAVLSHTLLRRAQGLVSKGVSGSNPIHFSLPRHTCAQESRASPWLETPYPPPPLVDVG